MNNSIIKTLNKQIILRYAIHIMVMLMLFVIPDAVMGMGNQDMKIYWGRIISRAFFFAVLFYVNYSFLINKLVFQRRHIIIFILINILLIQLTIDAQRFAAWALGSHPTNNGAQMANVLIRFRIRDYVIAAMTVGMSIAFLLSDRAAIMSQKLAQLEAAHRESEIKNLRNQLNPHFLFNTLNNIYALVTIDPAKARTAIDHLSHLLRQVLYKNHDLLIPLSQELNFINTYIQLMRIRLADNVTLTADIDEHLSMTHKVAPLIFISLIENAFKHGVSAEKPSFIRIQFSLQAHTITCLVANSYFPKQTNDHSGNGVGLDNIKKQLELIYPDAYSLDIQCDDKTYTATLSIDLTKFKI